MEYLLQRDSKFCPNTFSPCKEVSNHINNYLNFYIHSLMRDLLNL